MRSRIEKLGEAIAYLIFTIGNPNNEGETVEEWNNMVNAIDKTFRKLEPFALVESSADDPSEDQITEGNLSGESFAGDLATALDVTPKTIHCWATKLGIKTPEHGENSYRYPADDVIKFLDYASKR